MATQREIGCEDLIATQRQIGSKHPSRDTDSIGLIRVIDPVANGQRLMKSIDRESALVDPVHDAVDIVYGFFLRKIIP
jgi:hypothetical protein